MNVDTLVLAAPGGPPPGSPHPDAPPLPSPPPKLWPHLAVGLTGSVLLVSAGGLIDAWMAVTA